MKQNVLLPLMRLASTLSLFGIFLCMHLSFTLAYFLPSESENVMNIMYIFYFIGIVLGAVLCPFFLPLPGKSKPLLTSIGFIGFLTALECIFRFQGLDVWLGSAAVRGIMALPEGILTTMSYGLFYLTWQQNPKENAPAQNNQICKWCSLVFGAALLVSVLARYYSVPVLEHGIAAADHLKGAAFAFNCIKWGMFCMGLFAAANVFLLQKMPNSAAASPTEKNTIAKPAITSDWSVILRLAGLAAVFTILNGILNMRMLPLYSNEAVYHPHFPIVAAAVLVLGFLVGRSTIRFIRGFLPPVIILFILISCLPLFEENQQFEVFMSTLIAIAHYTIWMVFTTAVVEHYRGSFWFYGMTALIFSSVAFAFLAPIISRFVPDGAQYRVLFIVIAAVSFMLLAFRLLFPKLSQMAHPQHSTPEKREPFHVTDSIDDIFREYKLSQREIEVAHLLLKHGLKKNEIADRLCVAAGTVKIHITNIYKKFAVKTRAQFMALFVDRD